ncbi:hypothetical protein P171DRAFT_133441 [Karstenula rhodostoma CBS 690.94]|uniref:tRNA/rRNA methyltransferase SpoU type domain-containing protein n=1 Tax=Karstenula rhodostoma CBS 690.94 TaxID=1392251 RepID=A0A9P4P8J3_9PLEO|nr:hypothetical protein P171DRAFT_133441 [Karstenula rhodostoma CBS 690.94]
MAAAADLNVRSTSYAAVDYHGRVLPKEDHLQRLRACLTFLKCSYWLPEDRYHYITPALLSLLVGSTGKDNVDECAHDTLSSLLALLTKPCVTVLKTAELPDTWIQPDHGSNKPVLLPGALSDSFFGRFRDLPSNYFSSSASKAFRTWFQWINYVNANAVGTGAVYFPEYWSALRTGLVTGMADQRKYCLGIIQQSLLICQRSFEASGMAFDVNKKAATVEQYKKYCALFEIIVLDRYPNQVLACLPELTALLGPASLISPTWTTALLAAALNSKIQEGVRKLVGNWYLDYATSQPESCTTHTSFITEGFLPWVTQGSLFTSSLMSTRTSTTCSHGTALAEAFARLVIAAPGTKQESEADSPYSQQRPVVSEKHAIIKGTLQYISDAGGRIFSPSVLYLLEGLLKGIDQGGVLLDAAEIEKILGISRMPALPEIAADLCRIYCAELCGHRSPQISDAEFVPAQAFLDKTIGNMQGTVESSIDPSPKQKAPNSSTGDLTTLKGFLEELDRSRHKIIQNDKFATQCAHITSLLEKGSPESLVPEELLQILNAFWEEADRQDYSRPVAIRLAPLYFHPVCILTCLRQRQGSSETSDDLTQVITKALTTLHRFAVGRTYLVSGLATSFRKASFVHPAILSVLPFEDFFVRFIENPPVPKKEFLSEVVAAEKLKEHLPRLNNGKHVPNRDFEAYYGQREWAGYAALIDLLNRIPEGQVDVAKRVMKRLLEPWRTQKAPIPIISKSKNVLQLQIMLLLTESCVSEEDVDWYLESFMHALVVEPWPRYRYLLEWTITRIYYRFPGKTHRILDDLARLDESSPVHIASLMKLALLAAPFLDSDAFALKLMVQLIPFSASSKVHIRHEAHWCFPTLFDLAKERNWTSITDNPAFVALDQHVRGLEKFNAPPSTIRTLKLDAVNDFTLTNIFQGRYLSIETPDMEYVAHEDFAALSASDTTFPSQHHASPPRVPLGQPLPAADLTPTTPPWKKPPASPNPSAAPTDPPTSTFHQTKSGFDIASLLPTPGPPSSQTPRPASIILVASLIDNPTNLGGLSRISESFGLTALYLSDARKTAHRDFLATSVTSEKHLPIHELGVAGVPAFLRGKKREGWEVVGIEQTDRSGVLGERSGSGSGSGSGSESGQGDAEGRGGQAKEDGTLPHKCVLVLGAERSGITADVLAVVDRCVEIRTVGVTRSLNVQTAGGIAVYEWWREWGGKGTK